MLKPAKLDVSGYRLHCIITNTLFTYAFIFFRLTLLQSICIYNHWWVLVVQIWQQKLIQATKPWKNPINDYGFKNITNKLNNLLLLLDSMIFDFTFVFFIPHGEWNNRMLCVQWGLTTKFQSWISTLKILFLRNNGCFWSMFSLYWELLFPKWRIDPIVS